MEDNNLFDFDADFDNDDVSEEADLWMLDEDLEEYSLDLDGDGVDETFITDYDTDGDGLVDLSIAEVDVDGDGFIDAVIQDQDLNFDGVSDTIDYVIDSNGDGLIDIKVSEADLDGDGFMDVSNTKMDQNYDGQVDFKEVAVTLEEENGEVYFMRAKDLDFDGEMDEFEMDSESSGYDAEELSFENEEDIFDENDNFFNEDAPDEDDAFLEPDEDNGSFDDENDFEDDIDETEDEEENIFDFDFDDESDNYDDDRDLVIDLEQIDYDDDNDNGVEYTELQNFDPRSADSDNVIGEPESAMELFEYQGNTNRCAIYSQKFIIEEYTGQEMDVEELADLAEENGWFSESGGTPLNCIDKLLDHYDIPNETSSGNDINDIVESLNNGHRVIVAVDSDEFWYGEDDSLFVPADGPNHAMEVIGINNSDPENPTVIVNDSGNPNGCGVEIPMDTFIDSWEDGNCYMVECM